MDGEELEDDVFYVFMVIISEVFEILELCINDKIINVIVDLGVSCNFMLEYVFYFLIGGIVFLVGCDKNVYVYIYL